MCDDPDYDDRDIPEGHTLCPLCNGDMEVPCYCGGDLCICENQGEQPCPMCGGEYGGQGYVPQEKADRYWERQRELRDVLSAALSGK